MQIPINKDLDNNYTDDFFRGLSARQTLYSAATIAVGGGMFALFNLVLHIPAEVSIYLSVPFAVPFAAMGFVKIHGVPPDEYLKRMREARRQPMYYFEPELLGEDPDVYMSDGGDEDGDGRPDV